MLKFQYFQKYIHIKNLYINFLFLYVVLFLKISDNCLAPSPTVKDNIIFKRRAKTVKNRYLVYILSLHQYTRALFQLNSLVFHSYFYFFL